MFSHFEASAFCVGPSGSGKSTKIIETNVMALKGYDKTVIDFKADLTPILAGVLRKRGENVKILNLGGLFADIVGESDEYNPLHIVADEYWRPGGLQDVSDTGFEMCLQLYPEPIVVKLWRQDGRNGPYVTATLGRTYQNEQTGEYGESRSLGGSEVLKAQALLGKANEEMIRWRDYYKETERRQVPEQGETPTLDPDRNTVVPTPARDVPEKRPAAHGRETGPELLQEKLSGQPTPRRTYDGILEHTLEFLANPCKLWHSERFEHKRTVLRLAFAERLAYCRNKGYRTPETTLPFKVLGGLCNPINEMVPQERLELPT
ncbi:MAG: type IV secretory system conjugative DNA transfer family protein [Alphaproteobacteria bacterium]